MTTSRENLNSNGQLTSRDLGKRKKQNIFLLHELSCKQLTAAHHSSVLTLGPAEVGCGGNLN